MGHVPEADAADGELADERPRPSAQTATVAVTRLELRRPLRLIDLGDAGQCQASCAAVWLRNGIPKSRSNSSDSSGVPFLIPIVTFMPWKCSTLSARISGKTIWSASPIE